LLATSPPKLLIIIYKFEKKKKRFIVQPLSQNVIAWINCLSFDWHAKKEKNTRKSRLDEKSCLVKIPHNPRSKLKTFLSLWPGYVTAIFDVVVDDDAISKERETNNNNNKKRSKHLCAQLKQLTNYDKNASMRRPRRQQKRNQPSKDILCGYII
jgi:hypothetical protein